MNSATSFREFQARRAHLRLPGQGPRALRRGGVRRRGRRRLRSRKNRASPSAITPCRAFISTTKRWSRSARTSSPRRAASWKSPTSTWTTCAAATCASRIMGRGTAWLDTGTSTSLQEASNFIAHHREAPGHQGRLPRGSGPAQGFHRPGAVRKALTRSMPNCEYNDYLKEILSEVPRRTSESQT